MTAAHTAVKRTAEFLTESYRMYLGDPLTETNMSTLVGLSGVDRAMIPQIIADLRARGEWPEGLRVVGEEQK
jgi:hypothetical protein